MYINENLKLALRSTKTFSFTIAFHCSEMASISDWTSGQSKNLKKESKFLTRAFQITYFILILIYRWDQIFKKRVQSDQAMN